MIFKRSTDITSFTEHRKHLRDHLNQVRQTGRPLYVTTNGETDAVVMSPEAFDSLVEQAELSESLELLDLSMEDLPAGRVQPLETAVRKTAQELGLAIDG